MKIHLISPVLHDGTRYETGAVADLDNKSARILIDSGVATVVKDVAPAEPVSPPKDEPKTGG